MKTPIDTTMSIYILNKKVNELKFYKNFPIVVNIPCIKESVLTFRFKPYSSFLYRIGYFDKKKYYYDSIQCLLCPSTSTAIIKNENESYKIKKLNKSFSSLLKMIQEA